MNDAKSPPIIEDSTLITRNAAIMATPVRDEMIMMSVESGRYFGLDDIGRDIWNRLEKPCRFADLVDGLAADYAGDRAAIAEDVRKLLVDMAAHQVLRLG